MAFTKTHFLRRFEIYLAGATVLFLAAIVLLVLNRAPGAVTGAVFFFGTLSLQVLIQWADRERQRRLRAKAIHDIREMLQDRVLNQLSAIKVWAAMTSQSGVLPEMFDDVDAAIDEAAEMVQGLSEEQLDTWQLRYANSDAHRFQPDAALA